MGFAGVIKQGINGFLQKSLFVIYDAFGRSDFPHFLEPIVSVDDSAVKVIEVTGGEPSAIQLNHGSQFWGQNWQYFQDHPFRSVAGFSEGFNNLQSLDGSCPL
jgi:hypothetical protein